MQNDYQMARQSLSHDDAMMMIEAVRHKFEQAERSDGLAVAVVDAHGELMAFLRTDHCRLPSVNIAQNKAYTAAREQIATKTLGERSRKEGFPMTNFGSLRYVSWGGGIPIYGADDIVIGAIGVSGLPEDDDITFALHGIQALQASAD